MTTTSAEVGESNPAEWKVRVFKYTYCPEPPEFSDWTGCTIDKGVPLIAYDDLGHPDNQVRREYDYTQYGQVETVRYATPHQSATQVGKYETIYYDGHDRTFPRQLIRGGGILEPLVWDQAYDPRFGQINVNIDPKGLVQSIAYDGMGRTVYANGGDGTEVFTTYAPVPGLPMRVNAVSPGLGERTTRYDRLGRLQSEEWRGFEGERRSRHYEYDRFNNLAGASLPQYGPASLGAPAWAFTRYQSNAMGERQLEVHPNGRTIEYENAMASDYSVATTDDEGIVTHTIADEGGRVIARIDGNGNQRCYRYDAIGGIRSTWMIAEGVGLSFVEPCGDRPVVGAVTEMDYDAKGQLLEHIDPENGRRVYAYNGYGEVLRAEYPANAPAPEGARDADTFQYDALNRMIRHVRPEGEARYWWDLYTPGELGAITGAYGADTYMHDSAGRTVWENHQFAHESYESHVYDYAYDPATGLLETLTMPQAGPSGSRPRVGYRYDDYGMMTEVVEEDEQGDALSQLWRLWAVNQFDQPLLEARSDGGLWSLRFHDIFTGALNEAITFGAVSGTGMLQNMSVVRDERSMVTDRYDWVTWQHESFGYDDADRLETTYVSPLSSSAGVSYDFEYDQFGNMTRRDDVGTLTYEPRGTNPRALTRIGGMEVDYDRRGNQVRRGDTNLAYTSFDKPHTFESANDSVYFTYGPGTERIRRLSSVEDRTYAGGLYERVNDTDAHVTKHHYKVPGSTGVLAEMTIEEGFGAGEKKYTYVAPDELGSSTVVLERGPAANSALTVKERLSYGPWGNRRNPNDWRQADSGNASETTIGFTGHAEQETAGLIYMNARMYDPLSGRFVSADPIVPEPFSTDGWSRYVYVGNNPVGYTDPSGHNKDDEVEAKAEAPPPPPESECNMVIDAGAGTAETSGPDCGGPAQEPVDEVSSRADKTGGGGDPPPVVEQNDKMDTGLTRFAQATSGGDATTDAGSSSGTSPAKTDAQKLREMYGGRPFQGKDYSFGYSDVLVGTGHLDAAAGVFADYHTAVMFVGESAVAGPATKVVLKSAKAFSAGAKVATRGKGTEVVERWMSKAELEATKKTGLVRGGRDGTHYATDAANSTAKRARQRSALPQTPEVKVQLEVPAGSFSPPTRVQPAYGMPGGGMERTATGRIRARVID